MRRRSVLALGGGALALGLGQARAQEARAGARPPDRLEFVGRFRWRLDDPAFGGWSAIEVREDGVGFFALSDRSLLVEGRFLRDGAGRIAAIESGPIRPLTLKSGRLAGLDSEGLTLAPDGRLFISEEGTHRILGSRNPGRDLTSLPPLPGARDFLPNRSLEALAFGPDGALYTLPELSRSRRGTPIYRLRRGRWEIPYTIAHDPDWAAVGADFGPSGTFYLLERGFSPFAGFRSRLRAFRFAPEGATELPPLLETPFRRYGNLEGLSVWQDAEGRERFTMISDDNFLPFGLHTDIVEYCALAPLPVGR